MVDKLRVGLIGAGGIARAHANACAQVDEVELVAVSDVSVEHARKLGSECSVDACYGSVDAMLSDQQLDIAIICTWGVFHASVGIEVARSNRVRAIKTPIKFGPSVRLSHAGTKRTAHRKQATNGARIDQRLRP